MRFDVRHNVAEFSRDMTELQREHLPFAVSLAINDVVRGARTHLMRHLPRVLDRPVAFTRRSIATRLSSKRRLTASVFVMDRQAEYLIWQETGGTRGPKGKAIPVPAGIRLNAHGNMAKGALKRTLARKDTFATKPGSRLPGGIYQRTGGRRAKGLKMLVAFEPSATYRDRPLKFRETVLAFTVARLPDALRRAMERALTPRG